MTKDAAFVRSLVKVGRPVLTVLALGLAAWLVRRELGQLRLRDIAAAIVATSPAAVLASALLAAASYACLVAAEWCAFAYTGRPQPMRRLAPLSFSAHALASNLGFGLVSGAAVRLRLYRSLGLEPKTIAAVSALVSTVIFLSGVVTLGLTLIGLTLFAPARARGVAALAPGLPLVLPAALWFVTWRRLGLGGKGEISLRTRALGLAVSVGDWVFSGAALFVLSNHDPARFVPFLAVFVSGSLAGSLVGLPAALGVLDASVLGSAVLSGKVHETAAALVLYRAIYFLVPLGLVVLGSLGRWALKLKPPGA